MHSVHGLVLGAASSATVAIVAIVVSGMVGVAAPIIANIASSKRLARELDASKTRQGHALDAEAKRLDQQLEAESERLALTLKADQERSRTEAVRNVLDEGAALITRFGAAQRETQPSSTPGQLNVSERWAEMVELVAAYRNRLRLWFPDSDDAVQAFDEFLAFTNFHVEARLKPADATREALLESIEEDFHKRREAFLAAARSHLGN